MFFDLALQKISVIPPQSNIISNSSITLPVNINKQSTSFPPNFIHSLDSTHMLLIALNCSQYNLTSFAAVHDSFYSHASDYPILNELIKKQFIYLYSKPILNNLREELIERYKDYKVPVIKSLLKKNITFKIPSKLLLNNKNKRYKSNISKIIKKIYWRDIIIPPLPNEFIDNNNSDINEKFNITQVLDSEYFFN